MLSIIADALMTATRSKHSRRDYNAWDAPEHWRRTEGLDPRGRASRHGEERRVMKWYEITGPR